MPLAYIGVGSNIDPEQNVLRAVRLLKRRVRITGVSTFYRTEPVGRPEQSFFYNGVIEIETDLAPADLKYNVLGPIETELGRTRTRDKYAPRTIDLDLIVYDDLELESSDLSLPDPDIKRRPFLALPLYELSPGLILGPLGSLAEIASSFADQDMTPLPEYAERLRKEAKDEP